MIDLERVAVQYADAERAVLHDVDLVVDEGEMALVLGTTGVGKSTLLGTINGLVPHFTGGHLAGRVRIAGIDTRAHPPRELADVVGHVSQDPLAGFVTDSVEDELAYGMEQLAIAPDIMRKRVEEVLDLLGIAELRRRPLRALSGGQQQRVAIGSLLTAHPRVLLLDEPTSALDPTAAEEVLAAITRLVHDLGTTVVLAEHRVERVIQFADQIIHLPGEGRVEAGPPAQIMGHAVIAPPIVELGRLRGWRPLPLSVRDARRAARDLRAELERVAPPEVIARSPGEDALVAKGVVVRHGRVVAVDRVDLGLRRGSVTALMGRNGAGKSSLLWALQGSLRRYAGSVRVQGTDPGSVSPDRGRQLVGLVPQSASDILYLSTVEEECIAADEEAGADLGSCRELLDRIVPGIPPQRHPRDLSEGQRLALVLAVQLTSDPPVVLLDEPTRGLDYTAKAALTSALSDLAARGRSIVVATHDVEFVAGVADRVVVMSDGEVIADGPTAQIIAGSPAFAPQVAKVMAPQPWLTVDQVRTATTAKGGVAS